MSTNRPPLWKQVLGAVAGAGLALVLYSGYQEVVPQIQAYVQLRDWQLKPEGIANVRPAAKGISNEDYLRLEQRTREIMEDLGARSLEADVVPEVVEPTPPSTISVEEIEMKTAERAERRMEEVVPVTPPTVMHQGQETVVEATDLPDSGVGLLGAVLAAGAGAGAYVRRKKRG